jgi:hypothetical protein
MKDYRAGRDAHDSARHFLNQVMYSRMPIRRNQLQHFERYRAREHEDTNQSRPPRIRHAKKQTDQRESRNMLEDYRSG